MQQRPVDMRVGGAGGRNHATLLSAGASRVIVVEKRACDVLVLGDSALALAASVSLQRRGKKVIHLPDFGIQAPRPAQEALKPLLLLDTNLQLASMSNEAVRFFQGLEMQAGTALINHSRSIDVAHTRTPLRELQGTAQLMADLMTQLAETAKAAGFKVTAATATDLPNLRLPDSMTGLQQADGGVINAVAVAAALRTLAQRNSVMERDSLLLRGWQDMGSCLRVRASSRLQPDAVSIFETEQVLLAPGGWAPDCLRLWDLHLDLKLRARPALRCTSSADLSNMPLLRHWCTPDAPGSATQPAPPPRSGQGPASEGRGGGGAAAASKASAADQASEQRVNKHWVLFPRSGASGTCKLTGLAPDQSQVGSCWEVQELDGGADQAGGPAGSTGTRSGSDSSGSSSSGSRSGGSSGSGGRSSGSSDRERVMESEWQGAEKLVRGLGRPLGWRRDNEAGGKEEAEEDARQAATGGGAQTAWDVVTPDGLPVLGWHPGFEAGRVLVACTAGSLPAPPVQAAAQAAVDSRAGERREGRFPTPTVERRAGDQGVDLGGQPRQQQAGREVPRQAAVAGKGLQGVTAGALHDGWHLTPVLAKAAADMLMSVSLIDLPMNVSSLAVERLQASKSGAAVDTWDGLDSLQSGSAFQRQKVANMSEEQLQEREEAVHAQGVRAK